MACETTSDSEASSYTSSDSSTSDTEASRQEEHRPKFFLDIFAGKNAPLSQAAAHASKARFQPFDIMINAKHDILTDSIYESLLQLCWSGCIGLATSAPPCKEYSRLKMQPGGPPPLRTPEYMDGLPHLTPAQQEKVRQSKEIHRRGRQLLYAVMSKGGIGVLEQPPSSLAWLEPDNHNLFREFQGHIAWTDACRYGKDWAKSWAFASNHQRVASLSALCNHNISHQSIIGTKDSQGNYLSTVTTENPALLAEILIKQMSFRVSKSTAQPRPLPFSPKTSFALPHGPRLKMCDGAGHYSTADHSVPKPTKPYLDLATQWTSWARQENLDKKIIAHIAQAKPEAPLTEQEVQQAIEILYHALQAPAPANTDPEVGQPYRLKILSKLGIATQDPDLALLAHLEQGVPTGVIPPCRQAINGHGPMTRPNKPKPHTSICVKATGKQPKTTQMKFEP